ncbi:hypothetical protein D3C84_1184360 [compost metagenome]
MILPGQLFRPLGSTLLTALCTLLPRQNGKTTMQIGARTALNISFTQEGCYVRRLAG